MTTTPRRIAIKFNLMGDTPPTAKAIMPVFQRWIQEHAVEGLLIDVVDYKHVYQGPGVILIADEGDYGYDFGEGQVGLQYVRRRFLPDNLRDALRLVLRLTLIASQRLEDEESLSGVAFDYASARISFFDRLTYSNDQATFDALQGDIHAILSEIYGTDAINLALAHDDPREPFAIRYTVTGDVSVDQIEANLRQQEAPTT